MTDGAKDVPVKTHISGYREINIPVVVTLQGASARDIPVKVTLQGDSVKDVPVAATLETYRVDYGLYGESIYETAPRETIFYAQGGTPDKSIATTDPYWFIKSGDTESGTEGFFEIGIGQNTTHDQSDANLTAFMRVTADGGAEVRVKPGVVLYPTTTTVAPDTKGSLMYDTGTDELKYYDGSWQIVSAGGLSSHALDGAYHTATGLTVGWVVSADSPTTFSWKAPTGGGPGSGTPWDLPVWDAAGTALTDSMISQDSGGTTATVGGALTASGAITTTATSMAINTDGGEADTSYMRVGIRADFGYEQGYAYVKGLAAKGARVYINSTTKALEFTTPSGDATFYYDVAVTGDLTAGNLVYEGEYVSLSEGIMGEQLLRVPYINNFLFSAEKRFTIAKTGSTLAYNPVYLFDGNLSNYTGLQILDGNVVTLNFDLDAKGEVSNLVYPYGYLYIHVYGAYHLGSVKARLNTTNGGTLTWRTWRDGVNISNNASYQLWAIRFDNNYVCEDIEIEFTASGTDAWVSEIEWNLDRNLDHWAFAVVQKMTGNNLYGNLRLKDSSNVTKIEMTTAGAITLASNLTVNTIAAGTADYDKFLVSDTGVVKFRTGAEAYSDMDGYVTADFTVDFAAESLANLTTRDHGSLSSAPTSAHHVRYADSEAVSAVEAVTLDMTQTPVIRTPFGKTLWRMDDTFDEDLIRHGWTSPLGNFLTFRPSPAVSASARRYYFSSSIGFVIETSADARIFQVDYSGNVIMESTKTVDGVDVSEEPARISTEIDTDITTHAGDDDAHHAVFEAADFTTAFAAESLANLTTRAHSDLSDAPEDAHHTKIHNLIDTTNHPVAGLTGGHFLKATETTTYAFAAHGLTASDVGAAPAFIETQYTLPMFATTTTLGDSMISQNAGGTLATIDGGLYVGGGSITINNQGAGTDPQLSSNHVAQVLTVTGILYVSTIDAGASDYDKFLVSDGGLMKFRTGAEVLSDIGAAASSHDFDTHSGDVDLADLAAGSQGSIIKVGATDWEELAKGTSTYVLKSGATDISWSTVDYSELSGSQPAPVAHNLIDTTGHPVSSLNDGHFLKATGTTTYAFEAHGLVASDVGAAPAFTKTQWTIPVFDTATTLGDSMISQNSGGTLLTTTGIIHAGGGGQAEAFRVGNDASLWDVNVAGAMAIIGIATPANGMLIFGSDEDTNIYRSATNTLKTDDNLIVGVDLSVLGTGMSTFAGNVDIQSGNGASAQTGALNIKEDNAILIEEAGTTQAVGIGVSSGDLVFYVNAFGNLAMTISDTSPYSVTMVGDLTVGNDIILNSSAALIKFSAVSGPHRINYSDELFWQYQTSPDTLVAEHSDGAEILIIDRGAKKVGLNLGTTINEFSTDTNLGGDSDDAVPTEKAVKAYVDAAGGGPGSGVQHRLAYWSTTTTLGSAYVYQNSGGTAIGLGRTPGTAGSPRLEIYGTQASATAGPKVNFVTSEDNYPAISYQVWQHDNLGMLFDCYYDGSYRSSDVGSNFRLYKYADKLYFDVQSGIAKGGVISSWTRCLSMLANGDVGFGANSDKFGTHKSVPSFVPRLENGAAWGTFHAQPVINMPAGDADCMCRFNLRVPDEWPTGHVTIKIMYTMTATGIYSGKWVVSATEEGDNWVASGKNVLADVPDDFPTGNTNQVYIKTKALTDADIKPGCSLGVAFYSDSSNVPTLYIMEVWIEP